MTPEKEIPTLYSTPEKEPIPITSKKELLITNTSLASNITPEKEHKWKHIPKKELKSFVNIIYYS